MAKRTYLPLLKLLLLRICKYIGEHRDRILQTIGDENADALDGVIAACEILMPILDVFIPDGA